jgi:Tol biopolymer transport system component
VATKSYGAAVSPDGTRLAYLRTSGPFTTDWRLVVSDARGRDAAEVPITLPGSVRPESVAGWSPDGAALAVTVLGPAGRALVAVDPDGSQVRVLSPWLAGPIDGAWAPDGTRLLAVVGGQRGSDLQTVGPDGSGWRLLRPGICEGASWAPDGRSIVFQVGGCDPQGADGRPQLRTIAHDGSDERVLWAPVSSGALGEVVIAWQALPPSR